MCFAALHFQDAQNLASAEWPFRNYTPLAIHGDHNRESSGSGLKTMWVNTYLPAIQRYPAIGLAVSVFTVSLAIATKLVLPDLPPFITLFPAVLISALVGSRVTGRSAYAVSLVAAAYFVGHQAEVKSADWQIASLAFFAVGAGLIVFVIEQLHTAISRLLLEKAKLDLVLHAAGAATWALQKDKKMTWDENFFRLVGIKYSEAPSSDAFLEMIHPDDRPKMALGRNLMNAGSTPAPIDEYRLFRPDGTMLWLENRRVRSKGGDYLFVGITQDITHRKKSEERIQYLMRELAHRVKNQLAVVTSIASETRRSTETAEEFSAVFSGRMLALAKSHELLVNGDLGGVELAELLQSQLAGFADERRLTYSGPKVSLSRQATQYLAMAFHELATNAVKYGALSVEHGSVQVEWHKSSETFSLTWKEFGGPAPGGNSGGGFGTTVLTRLTPSALQGTATLAMTSGGVVWSLSAPLAAL